MVCPHLCPVSEADDRQNFCPTTAPLIGTLRLNKIETELCILSVSISRARVLPR